MTRFLNRRTLIGALLPLALAATFAPQTTFAFDPLSTSEVNVDARKIAVKGYDVVAYFTMSKPTLGNPTIQADFQGASYFFSSEAHRDAFKATPAKYVPQYGGFCAMGVALDKKLDGDPLAWKIVDNKLYLNLNADVQKKWLTDVPGHLNTANTVWPKIKSQAPKSL